MYLTDAHNRVMSVAELQRQLSETSVGDVELRAYFTALCASISASMIRDPGQIVLSVDSDDSLSTADVSVSLGLIVTELVINSLKHAFPNGGAGRIVVRYRSQGPDWTLSVTDNGVGLPRDPADAPPGLGTSIVRALSQQLAADIAVTSAGPGMAVSIRHREPAPGETRLEALPLAV
jgi:two-component sensor histidine kinase